jgi:spore coat polysaccharide biosynthesis protein SpsF
MTNTVILCARQSSTRLTGKALVPIRGKPVLQHLVERYQTSDRVHTIVVATSDLSSDDGIEQLCAALDVPCYRGSLNNVVRRMDDALKTHAPDAAYVFRAMGDMILIDIDLLDWRYDLLRRHGADVIWPGLQTDPWPVYGSRESPWSRSAWDRIAAESKGDEMEHPGKFLYSRMREFFVIYTEGLMDEYYSSVRFELDTPDDLVFFRTVFNQLHTGRAGTPRTLDVLRWLETHRDVVELNADVEVKTLTNVSWRRRGVAWACEECGAQPMRTGTIRRGAMMTECPNCGVKRPFKELPAFLAGRGRE